MTNDLFGSLFELQDSRVDRLGNPLVELDEMIDWDGFRKTLKRVNKIPIKGKAGAKPKDVVMMFKGLVIQNLYGLSDDQLEYQIEDRRSFQRFIGFNNHHHAPDAKTFWSFRNRLTELKLVEPLFNQLTQQLNAAGFVARKGQIVDASSSDSSFSLALEQLVQRIAEGEIEIYNEFSLQHELGIVLRNNVEKDRVQFERNVSYFGFTKQSFEKREIDIVVYDPETKALNYAIELKFPRNGQHPEQMFSFCKDIVFMEQVKKAGFARTYVVIFVDDALFYEGRSDGIYGYFRGSEKLHGSIEKPTGAKNKTLHIEGSYQVNWLNVRNQMKYTVIEAE